MSDDEFEDEPEIDEEDLDEDVIAEDFDEELLDDDLADDARRRSHRGRRAGPVGGRSRARRRPAVEEPEEDDEDDVVDLDEELHPDDVEEALDVVLRERTVAAGLEGEEDDDEPDEPGEGGTKIVPRRENEFFCRSCFLVLPRHQLADEARMICRDCV